MSEHDEGFTLIETLAALLIFALAAGTFFGAMEAGTRGAQLAEREANALAIAQSRLDQAVASSPQDLIVRTGQTSDGFMWVTRFAEHRSTLKVRNPLNFNRIDVRVSWRDRLGRQSRDLTLTTLTPVKSQ